MSRCYIAQAEEKIGTKAYPVILDQLKEKGELITPSLVIITAVAVFLRAFMDNVWIKHAFMGIRGAVCALMLNTVYTLAKKSLKSIFAYIMCAAAFIVAMFLPVPTVVIVLAAAVVGIVSEMIVRRKRT